MHGLVLTTALQLATFAATAQPYDQAYAEMQKSGRPLVVMVGAPWCHACHVMKDATLQKLEERGTLSRVELAHVDLDEEPELARKLMRGTSIPQLILYSKTPSGWKRTQLVGVHSELTVASLVDTAVANSVAPDARSEAIAQGTTTAPRAVTADE